MPRSELTGNLGDREALFFIEVPEHFLLVRVA